MSDKLKETSKKFRSAEEKIEELSSRGAKLQKDNKVLVAENAKLEEKIKNTMPVKEHEDMVTHLKVSIYYVHSIFAFIVNFTFLLEF